MTYHIKDKLRSSIVFVRECLRSPRSMGTLCPSGKSLAKAMASKVTQGDGLVVELGAGTGSVTAALIREGIHPHRLLLIERSSSLVDLLRTRFPEVTVIHGDAAHLSQYLLFSRKVDCIVSSIPFLALPQSSRQDILNEIKNTLNDGTLLQYTYGWKQASCLSEAGLTCVSSTRVWQNIPPAKVMEFRFLG